MLCVGSFIPLILLEPGYSTQRGESRFGNLIKPVIFIYVIIQTCLPLPFPLGQSLYLEGLWAAGP